MCVDAQENPLFTIYNSRFYEVQDYLSLTEHFYPVCPLMMSEITWNKLSPEQQVIVEDALRKSVDYERAGGTGAGDDRGGSDRCRHGGE